MKRCDRCQFFAPKEGSDSLGSCRYNAPTVILTLPSVTGQCQTLSAWPHVQDSQWCRHFESKENKGMVQ